jgi:GH18 family chitinase
MDFFFRLDEGNFKIEDIDPTLCTHGFYGFADINNEVSQGDGRRWKVIDFYTWICEENSWLSLFPQLSINRSQVQVECDLTFRKSAKSLLKSCS